jgi:putative ABC transport system substrate-binding protein
MKRREFLACLSAALATRSTPLSARQATKLRTVGVLLGLTNDKEMYARAKVIEEGLAERGWVVGQNIRIEYRFAGADHERMRNLSSELVGLQPEVIIGHSTPVVTALHQATQAIPIVFVVVGDPVGSGFVARMARPGGNITGFSVMWPTITGKYLSILRALKPELSHVALMYNIKSGPSTWELAARTFTESAKSFHVTPVMVQVDSPAGVETAMAELAAAPGSALIVMPGNFTTFYRQLIISRAARLRIPTVYPYRYFVDEGGLLSYGVDVLDLFRRAPDYVDRILQGAKPADLPVQAPRKFELVINLAAARAMGLVVPRILLAGANALID